MSADREVYEPMTDIHAAVIAVLMWCVATVLVVAFFMLVTR